MMSKSYVELLSIKNGFGKKMRKMLLLAGCRVYGRLSHEGPRPMGGMPSVGGLSKGS